MLDHCRRVAEIIPLVGFYLQPAVGGRVLDRSFWRGFLDIERVVAIKVAPFDRYRTLDVTTALAESGRRDVALYTGNDDAIVADLLTPFPGGANGPPRALLGRSAWPVGGMDEAALSSCCNGAAQPSTRGPRVMLPRSRSACWRSAPSSPTSTRPCSMPRNQFAGCIPGIHEVLRRQGLLAGRWCLDPHEDLSPGQMEAIDRALARYRHLSDDGFVRENLGRWMA